MISIHTNGEIVLTLGNANPDNTHLAGRIVAMDDEIIPWLALREKRRGRRVGNNVAPR